ncbi:TonB-dependent receptor plug domain-containing protein [Sphingomonas sp. CFBP8993]|nr:TonB-dependent receptor plug domain-containing protein [Sphingomonas sp. CFBP8993]
MKNLRLMLASLSVGGSALSMIAGAAPAMAQSSRISVPEMPLADALHQISRETGVPVDFDPDAVRGKNSVAVHSARTAEQAVREATHDSGLTVEMRDGRLAVFNDIFVVARRDAAETNYLVRATSTSSRTGKSLREQPRTAQIISSKLMEEQQSQSVFDALRNVGGVTVNTATVQGGVTYSVRGFATSGLTNGMPTGVAGASTQPVANVERLEVLKGPDAILAGMQNLGGAINIVTKKPSADTFVQATAEAGSFGQYRFTGDAFGAVNSSKTVSARMIVSVNQADRNWGGYAGLRDNLVAPSIRFKNGTTDVIAGVSLGDQFTPAAPYTLLNPDTNQPFEVSLDKPLWGQKNQGARTETVQAYVDLTQKVTDWLTFVVRGQHQDIVTDVASYGPFAVFSGSGTVLLNGGHARNTISLDTVDSYGRFEFKTGPLRHMIIAGGTYVQNSTLSASASKGFMAPYNLFTPPAPPPLPAIDQQDYITKTHQTGYYGQYMLNVWKLSLVAGVRGNDYGSNIRFFSNRRPNSEGRSSSSPNFGAVFDVTKNVSIYGTLAYGYTPTVVVDFNRNLLPDVETRNSEAGVKIDLFHSKVLLQGSYFKLRQSVAIIADPLHPGYVTAAPGLQSQGIDLSIIGQITPNWMISGTYVNAQPEVLTLSQYGNTVQGQPRESYSLYSSYRHKLSDDVTAGLSAGAFGRSSAAVTRTGSYYVPPAIQIDLNGFLSWQKFDLNIGIRNLFDRRNYGISYNTTYLPIQETRTVRVTLSYRFR